MKYQYQVVVRHVVLDRLGVTYSSWQEGTEVELSGILKSAQEVSVSPDSYFQVPAVPTPRDEESERVVIIPGRHIVDVTVTYKQDEEDSSGTSGA